MSLHWALRWRREALRSSTAGLYVVGALIGIDVGTTSVKVLATVPDGDRTVSVSRDLPWRSTREGTEIEPDVLFHVVLDAVTSALDDLSADRVDRLGIASFAESVVLLDFDGRAVYPLVAWRDPRGSIEAAELATVRSDADFSRMTGLPLSNLCTAVKTRALIGNAYLGPRVGTVLSVADWLAFRPTGQTSFDLSLASRTGWLQLRDRTWDATLVEWSGLKLRVMPQLARSGAPRGTVGAGVADGLTGALVVVASVDHLVAAVGGDTASAGSIWDSCGTAEAFVRTSDPLSDDVERAVAVGLTVGWHVVPDQFAVLGALRSGYAFSRLLHLVDVHSASELAALESQSTERDSESSAVVFGDVFSDTYSMARLTSTTTPIDVWSDLVAHIVATGSRMVDEIDRLCGAHGRFVIGGGWSTSRILMNSKTALHPATTCAQPELRGALGAAMLAAEASPTLADRSALSDILGRRRD